MSQLAHIWYQSRRGRVIDMVEPRADQVDFAEIADQCAHVIRYAGAANQMVSVANHTLICDRVAQISCGTERLRALVLMHDLHETRIGETPSPSNRAKLAIARQIFGQPGADIVRDVLAIEKQRHDAAIYRAGGIEPPSSVEETFIHHCDVVALVTERRDFLAAPPMSWGAEIEAATPLRQRQKLLPPADAAIALHGLMLELLPGARAQSARAPARTTARPA